MLQSHVVTIVDGDMRRRRPQGRATLRMKAAEQNAAALNGAIPIDVDFGKRGMLGLDAIEIDRPWRSAASTDNLNRVAATRSALAIEIVVHKRQIRSANADAGIGDV